MVAGQHQDVGGMLEARDLRWLMKPVTAPWPGGSPATGLLSEHSVGDEQRGHLGTEQASRREQVERALAGFQVAAEQDDGPGRAGPAVPGQQLGPPDGGWCGEAGVVHRARREGDPPRRELAVELGVQRSGDRRAPGPLLGGSDITSRLFIVPAVSAASSVRNASAAARRSGISISSSTQEAAATDCFGTRRLPRPDQPSAACRRRGSRHLIARPFRVATGAGFPYLCLWPDYAGFGARADRRRCALPRTGERRCPAAVRGRRRRGPAVRPRHGSGGCAHDWLPSGS